MQTIPVATLAYRIPYRLATASPIHAIYQPSDIVTAAVSCCVASAATQQLPKQLAIFFATLGACTTRRSCEIMAINDLFPLKGLPNVQPFA